MLALTEFVLGEEVGERLIVTRLEAQWCSETTCHCVAAADGRILLLGLSGDRKRTVCFLIDVFTGTIDGEGEIRSEGVSLGKLKIGISGLEYLASSEIRGAGSKLILSTARHVMYHLSVDAEGCELIGTGFAVRFARGENACLQPMSGNEAMSSAGGPRQAGQSSWIWGC